jgi:hypothetical protein
MVGKGRMIYTSCWPDRQDRKSLYRFSGEKTKKPHQQSGFSAMKHRKEK